MPIQGQSPRHRRDGKFHQSQWLWLGGSHDFNLRPVLDEFNFKLLRLNVSLQGEIGVTDMFQPLSGRPPQEFHGLNSCSQALMGRSQQVCIHFNVIPRFLRRSSMDVPALNILEMSEMSSEVDLTLCIFSGLMPRASSGL